MTKLIHTIDELRKELKLAREKSLKIGLVPTMGALHEGHISLMKKAKEVSDVVVVSIYVNPTQFGINEDFSKYPRTLDDDLKTCTANGVDFVFAPNTFEMYGVSEANKNLLSQNYLTYVTAPYNMTDILCGKSRIGHFDGVATVVTKLFNITGCDYAFFGQKDAQQLIIIKKLVKDLNIPVEIIPCPIVREKSGLALSSRNTYLTSEGKQKALCLSKILNNAKMLFETKNVTDFSYLQETAFSILPQDVELEYFEAVDFETLEPIQVLKSNTLLAIAAKVDNVRLIDNVILE